MKKIPFPQANNIELIFNILNDVGPEGLSKTEVAKKYHIEERQGSYYLDSLLYLHFVEKYNTKYFLNEKGVRVRLAPKDEMKKLFVHELLSHEVISELYDMVSFLGKEEQERIISNYLFVEFNMAMSTAKRRANTIVRWFEWIKLNLKEGD